jgi:type I restriction enzyme S subunit
MSSDVAEMERVIEEVPDGWIVQPLSRLCVEVAERVDPATLSRDHATHYVGLEHIGQGSGRLDGVGSVADVVSQKSRFRAGDILYGKLRPNLRKVARPDFGGVCSTDVIVFRATKTADPDFVFQVLQSEPLVAHAIATAAGTKMPRTHARSILSFEIAAPPLDEQRRSAEVLRSVDEAIAAADRALTQTIKVARDVMKLRLVLPRAASDPLPEGWGCSTMGGIGKVQAGRQRAPNFTSGIVRPYLRVANVFDGFIDTSDVLEMPFTDREYAEYRLLPGDILLNEGQSIELVGRAARYEGEPADCCFQNTLVRLRATAVNPDYAYALIRTMYSAGRFTEIASRTTSVAHLGVSRFASLLVPVPPPAEQAAIADLFDSLERTVIQQRACLSTLRVKKDAVIASLLSGRVRVPA